MAKRWMQGAVTHPGVFSAEARRQGKTTHELAEEKKDAPGTEGKRARLALTFAKFAKHRAGAPQSPESTNRRRRG
jgi:hypothetical protein